MMMQPLHQQINLTVIDESRGEFHRLAAARRAKLSREHNLPFLTRHVSPSKRREHAHRVRLGVRRRRRPSNGVPLPASALGIDVIDASQREPTLFVNRRFTDDATR